MGRSTKLGTGKKRPALVKECQTCEYFVREVSGGPACDLKGIFTVAANTCAGWEPRQACRVCGCSHHDPCPEGCWWVEPDLCSACAEEERS